MEKYTLKTSLPKPIKMGEFKDLVYNNHVFAYGKESADGILKTAKNILKDTFKQETNPLISNNSLLVGKVQSGKTSNLEMLTALLFDNGYNLMIIYGGYDSHLLKQCVDRFSDTFDYKNDKIHMISTDGNDLSLYDSAFFDEAIDEGKPIIISSMKRPLALSKVNDCLKGIKTTKIKPFIIDDEGDQASLNTEKNKATDASATYREICRMKTILNDPIYYSVTATPQANIFQTDLSKLKPDSIHLIRPGNAYDGASVFHLLDNNIVTINKDDLLLLDNQIFADSLKNAVQVFLISSAIMKLNNEPKSDMIVHTYREINGHMILHDMINGYIGNVKDNLKNNNEDDINCDMNEIKKVFISKYFSDEILKTYTWDSLVPMIKKVVKSCIVIEKNSKHGYDESILKAFNHIIHIGGDLLQRGITFKKLVTTYFTRWSATGNMDTSLQRARWFGYRENFLDLCRLFLTQEIKTEFSNLAEIEENLWSEFELVEKGEMAIKDIVIDAGSTSLNPTRKNVADYKKAKFAMKWNNQREISLDINDVKHNNSLIEELINRHYNDFKPSSIGRNDDKNSNYYCEILADEFVDVIKKMNHIFDQKPFSKADLITQLSKETKVCVELMTSFNELNSIRERSVYDNKISALQQGADSTDKSKQHYVGDLGVIVNPDMVNIQVFKILPIIQDNKKVEFEQYMFSIHFPKNSIVYKREN